MISENNKKIGSIEFSAISDIIDFFDYGNSLDKNDFAEIEEEASFIAIDLVLKVLGKGTRNIELPIKIKNIENFCISNTIERENIIDIFLGIILKIYL